MTATATGIFSKAKKQAWTGNINWLADTFKGMLVNAASPNFAAAGWGAYSDASGSEITATGYTAGGVTLAGLTATLTDANSWATVWAVNTAYKVGQIVKPAAGNTYVYKCDVTGTSQNTGTSPTLATNASPCVITQNGHGLSNGNAITITGATGNTAINSSNSSAGYWLVAAVTTNTYELMDPGTLALVAGNGAYGASSATVLPFYPTTIGQSVTDGGVQWTCFATTVLSFSFTAPSWAGFTGTADALIVYKSGTGGGTSPITNPLLFCLGFGATTVTGGTLQVNLDATSFAMDIG